MTEQEAPSPLPDVADGEGTLHGRYRIEGVIGEGAMGTVYRATHLPLDRVVAIKRMHASLAERSDMVRRFTVEARTGARLDHQNIVTTYDFGIDPDQGGLFIVLEFLAGPRLSSVLEYAQQPINKVVDTQLQLLAALEHAHSRNVVHRDVTPSNIVLQPTPGGEVLKLIDFGVARNTDTEPFTLPGQVIGSPHYMSPEQIRGESATTASDVYSAGVVLFELLTGRCPFEGESVGEIFASRDGAERLEAVSYAPEREVPQALSDVCRRAMAADANRRYSSARVFARALALAGSQEGPTDFRTAGFRASMPVTNGPSPAALSVIPVPRVPSFPDVVIGERESQTPITSPPAWAKRNEELDGADFRLLLKLEKKAKSAQQEGRCAEALELTMTGVRAASALYDGGQREIGATAVADFGVRATLQLVAAQRFEDAKALLGSILSQLRGEEELRARLLKLLSRVQQELDASGRQP